MKKCILTALTVIFIIFYPSGDTMAQSVNTDKRTITVSGEGIINVVPDMATVRFGIVVQHEDPEEARRINAETARNAMNSIREMGIADSKLSLQTLRLQPVREYDPQTRRQINKGYEATRELIVVIEDLDVLPAIISSIVQKGANRLNGISYGLKDKSAIKDRALVLAVQHAKHKATIMAQSLGVSIGQVLIISEQSFSVPTPVLSMEAAPRMMMAKGDAAPEPEAYAAGEIEVKAVVQVVFELE